MRGCFPFCFFLREKGKQETIDKEEVEEEKEEEEEEEEDGKYLVNSQ